MARKFIYKHRRGLAEDWKTWLTTDDNKLEDGEIGIIDSDPSDSPNHLRLLVGDGERHTYEEMPKFAYAQEENNSVVSQGYDYAEYFLWSDDVPVELRTDGRFVTIAENTRTIRPAQPDDKVLGITSHTASIIGNWNEGERAAEEGWAIVGMLGIVEVKHDHTCTKNGYAMIGVDGIATKADDAFGYKVVNVNDEAGTIEVVLGNDSDMISRIKSELNQKADISHIENTSNPHNVTKEQLELGNVDNTSDIDKPISAATQKAIDDIEFIAKGRATGYVFDTVEDLDIWLSDEENTSNLNLGDNLYIRATEVPDYWWDGSAKQELETQKVNLDEYVKNTDYATKDSRGIVAVYDELGISQNDSGQLHIVGASEEDIDNQNRYYPITPANLEYAVKSVGDGYYADKADVEGQISEINQIISDVLSGGSGEIDLGVYETKTDATAKLEEAKAYADSAANIAESNANAHSDELNSAMDDRVLSLEDDAHTHSNADELNKIVTGDKAKWDGAVAEIDIMYTEIGSFESRADANAKLAEAKGYTDSLAQTIASTYATKDEVGGQWKKLADVSAVNGDNDIVVALSDNLLNYREARLLIHIGAIKHMRHVHVFAGTSVDGIYLGECATIKNRYGTVVIPSIYEVNDGEYLVSILPDQLVASAAYETGGSLISTAVNNLLCFVPDNMYFGDGGRIIVLVR